MKYKAVKKEAKASVPDRMLPFVTGFFFVSAPFIFSFTGFEKFRVSKDIYASICIVVVCTLFLISRKIRFRFRPRTWEFVLGATVVFVALHTISGKRPDVGFPGFLQIVYFSALVLVMTEIASKPLQRKVWFGIGAAAALNGGLTVLQYFGFFPIMLKPTGEVLSGRLNAAGFVGDVNSGGFLFGLSSLILLYGIVAETSKKLRFGSVVLLCLNILGLAFTRTLTAILALGICLIMWLFFHHWWVFRTRRKITRQLVVFWILLAVGLAGAAIAITVSGAKERMALVWSQMKQGDWSVVTAGRQPVFVITWDMIRQSRWLGHGLNTFGQDFFFYRAGSAVGQRTKLVDQPGVFREAHNEYLQVWDELGFVGLLLFATLLFWPLITAVPLLFRTKDAQTFYWIGLLCLGILFVAISSLSFFPFHLSVTSAYIVLLVAGLRHFEVQERMPVEAPGSPLLLKTFLLLLPALGLVYPQLQKWRANNEMGAAVFMLESLANLNLSPGEKALMVSKAQQKLKKAEQLYPRFYEIYNLQGSAAMMLGNAQAAKRYYQKAAGYLPSPELFTNLAAAHLAENEFEQARPLLQIALRYNPECPRAQQALEYLKNNHH